MQTELSPVLQVAAQHLQQGQPESAAALLEPLTGLHPRNPGLWQLLALARKGISDMDGAEQAFLHAIALAPQAPVLANLGNLYRATQRYHEALSCYERALELAPDHLPAQVNRGRTLLDLEDPAGAEVAFSAVLGVDAQRMTARIGLAQALQAQGRQEEALDRFQAILADDPTQPAALNGLGVSLKILGYADDAVDVLLRAARAVPESPEVQINLASALVQADRQEEAIASYQRALDLDPLNPHLHHWYNGYLGVIGHPDYLASYATALSDRAAKPALAIAYARKLLLNGRAEEGIEVLTEARANPVWAAEEQAPLYSELSHLLRESGHFEDALKMAETAWERLPNDPSVRQEWATALLAAGSDYGKALSVLEALRQEQPHAQGILALYATALRYVGDEDRYRQLIDYDKLVRCCAVDPPADFESRSGFTVYLRNALLQLHTTSQHPIEQSMVHGTQTLDDLFSRRDPAIVMLRDALYHALCSLLSDWSPSAEHPLLSRLSGAIGFSDSWSVLLHQQGYHKNHFHSEGWLSSAFYLWVPDAVNGGAGEGWIKFGEPGFRAREPLSAEYWVKPEEGTFVVFPSYLWHGTEPLTTASRRMTVGYDILPA